MRIAGTAAVATCAALIAGCGGSAKHDATGSTGADRAQMAKIVDRLGVASRARDGRTICRQLLTANLEISITKAAGHSCEREVGRNLFGAGTRFTMTALDVRADGWATARVVDQTHRASQVLFRKQGGVWRIARIGS